MSDLPGVSRLILVADEKFPRFSEGDVIELSDGRLLLAVTRKQGASDFAAGSIIGMFSQDRGMSWDDKPHVIQPPFDDVGDVMSVSLFRTKRGIHLLFLGRGPNVMQDTRVYQIISADEGKTWSKPIRVSTRPGYHIVNNARIHASATGRLIVPCAWVHDNINKQYNRQRIYCLLSDDDAQTWQESGELVLENEPLMEPGVAQCADGSIYMTIRTKLGVLYEARSRDDGRTWIDFGPSKLPSPAAPSTVHRDPASQALWMFWINRPKGTWKQRTPLSFARSDDHGKTWSTPRDIENAKDHGYGYLSVTVVADHALLTYYDWHDRGQDNFHLTSLRQRTIPLAWLKGEPTPPVFSTERADDAAGELELPDLVVANSAAGTVRIIENPRGTFELFAAVKETSDEGVARYSIARAAGSDARHFPPVEIVLQPDPGEQLIGMEVLCYRGFYLGMLHVLEQRSGVVQPQWTWSHDGQSWARTRTACISLGDRGAFDSRAILMGRFELSAQKVMFHYRGSDRSWPDAAKAAVMGVAALERADLDAWLDTLPQP